VDPSDPNMTPKGPSREPFPARARLRQAPEADGGEPGYGDAVLAALHHLWRLRPVSETNAGQILEAERRQAARELVRQQQRLRLLLGLSVAPVSQPSTPPPAAPEEARELLDRARAFHEEWRQLLPGEAPQAGALREFSASPYLDLLERTHDRLWLLLDQDGCLLRAGRPQLAPGPAEPGLWLEPGPLVDGLLKLGRPGWLERGPWLPLELEGGWFLVSLQP